MLMVVIGLPGSGKSTWAKEQAMRTGSRLYEDFLGAHKPLDHHAGLFDLLEEVRRGRAVLADDIFLCRERDRRIFETLLGPFVPDGYEVRWVCFTKEPEICRRNVELRYSLDKGESEEERERREDRRKHSLRWINDLTPLFSVPMGAKVIPVVDHTIRA